jgi:hypothetical protein
MKKKDKQLLAPRKNTFVSPNAAPEPEVHIPEEFIGVHVSTIVTQIHNDHSHSGFPEGVSPARKRKFAVLCFMMPFLFEMYQKNAQDPNLALVAYRMIFQLIKSNPTEKSLLEGLDQHALALLKKGADHDLRIKASLQNVGGWQLVLELMPDTTFDEYARV